MKAKIIVVGVKKEWKGKEIEMKPYHNEGFGVAYITLLFFILILPAIILFTSLGTWDMFWKMHLPDGDCWENSRHEKVCKPTANCKIGRNFCD